jgi:hypothetical protein
MNELARILGEPRWLVSQRCRRLGLTRPRKKEPPWSAAEDELMKRVPLHDPDKCSEIFRAHGFNRTATAIMVRAKRINPSRRNTCTFSARSAALVIGWDNKSVSEYCLKGLIKSTRRKTKEARQNKLSNLRLRSYGERSGTQFNQSPLSEEGMRCSDGLIDGTS